MHTRCPHCDEYFQVSAEHLGKQAKCRWCHERFVVAEHDPPPPDKPKAKSFRLSRRACPDAEPVEVVAITLGLANAAQLVLVMFFGGLLASVLLFLLAVLMSLLGFNVFALLAPQ